MCDADQLTTAEQNVITFFGMSDAAKGICAEADIDVAQDVS